MEYRREGQLLYLLLADGEQLGDSIATVQRREGLQGGVVVSGVGMLRDFELAYLTSEGTYLRNPFHGPLELLSLQGSLNWRQPEDQPLVHLHGILSDQENKVVGGHLFGGSVCVLAEVTILVLDGLRMERHQQGDSRWWIQKLVDAPDTDST